MTESYEERYWQAMRSRYEELTGSRPEDASDIAIRLRVLAGQLAGLQQSLDEMFRQAFPPPARAAAWTPMPPPGG